MTKQEYEFLTGRWEGVEGAAYNQVYSFCRRMGWFVGLSDHDEPIPTQKGVDAMKEYQASDNWKKVDVI